VSKSPYRQKWQSFMQRTMNMSGYTKGNIKDPALVSKEWLEFTNFERWMKEQVWEGLHLDKDILSIGVKMYSESTCCFVPGYINTLLTDRKNYRGDLPLGVTRKSKDKTMINDHKNAYVARVCSFTGGKRKYLGVFETPMEAHRAWQKAKALEIEKSVVMYANEVCYRTDVAESLIKRAWDLQLDCLNNVETKGF